MTMQTSIFGLRFRSNVEVIPNQEELASFLASPKKEQGPKRHTDDLAGYHRLLNDLQAFERHHQPHASHQDVRGTMFFGVIGHSQFIHPSLKSAVEQYKYLLHVLMTLDLRKPMAFIASAEEEMEKLNPKKKDQALRLERLRSLVNDRKELLAKRRRRRDAATDELVNIAGYVRDNLARITSLCDASLDVLENFRQNRETEHRLIEDVKSHFKEQVRDSLHNGQVTKLYLETVQNEVALLSRELSSVLENDANALTGLYRSLHDHTARHGRELTVALADLDAKKDGAWAETSEVLQQIERLLVSLVSEYRLELGGTEPHIRSIYPSIILEKRKEAIEHLFSLLNKDRRSLSIRRSRKDRRLFSDPSYKGPERRSGKDRRAKAGRRRS